MTKSTFKQCVKNLEEVLNKHYGKTKIIQLEDNEVINSLAVKRNGYLEFILQVNMKFEIHNLIPIEGHIYSSKVKMFEEALKEAKEMIW